MAGHASAALGGGVAGTDQLGSTITRENSPNPDEAQAGEHLAAYCIDASSPRRRCGLHRGAAVTTLQAIARVLGGEVVTDKTSAQVRALGIKREAA